MKKVKKLVSLLMALSMVFSLLAVNASAATPPDDPGISPLDATPSAPTTLNVGSPRQSISLPIAEGYNYWKIHIRTTNPNVQFNITKNSVSGGIVYEEVVYESRYAGYGDCVPTGGQAYYGTLPAGKYTINIYVVGGQTNLQGTLWYKTATNEAEAM
ncbi:MAG: hypothetical protein K2P18_07195 [Oscillospiraceae bacterium]|nr:hypothetical protein [Oscillospiraceae bacterium]